MKRIPSCALFLGMAILTSCSERTNAPSTANPKREDPPVAFESPATFTGLSGNLKRTEIIPTLDSPITPGHNVIWCASFQAAWKTLESDLAAEPVALEGSPEMARLLNAAPDPRAHVPSEALYTAAGWVNKGIIQQIHSELKQRFPNDPPPTFPGIEQDSFLAYALLQAHVKFSPPYCQSRSPVSFIDSNGKTTQITGFGILPDDAGSFFDLRLHPHILFEKREPEGAVLEFAMDLYRDSLPSQIVVARISPEPTLAAAIAKVETECANQGSPRNRGALEGSDSLVVPDIHFFISHRFSQLEHRSFENDKLHGQRLDHAQQDIRFRLDKSGAELRSEAKMYAEGFLDSGRCFHLDRPFLVYMKKRGAQTPYFAMWVDNAELLRHWGSSAAAQAHQTTTVYNREEK